MRNLGCIGLADVQKVYDGPEADLWELLMGEQIHIGGLQSSLDLAARGAIQPGTSGVDLCCCTGAGMRFLVRFRQVATMVGIDATANSVTRGLDRTRHAGMAKQIQFIQSDVCQTGIADASFDFVWGEDAWCYVANKPRLIFEAARLVRCGGIIAFTDWVEGPIALTDGEADRFFRFMNFPSFADRIDYVSLLRDAGCDVLIAQDTRRFRPCIDLYLKMIELQLSYDALRIVGFDRQMLTAIGEEMSFIQELAHAGKVIQAIFVARR